MSWQCSDSHFLCWIWYIFSFEVLLKFYGKYSVLLADQESESGRGSSCDVSQFDQDNMGDDGDDDGPDMLHQHPPVSPTPSMIEAEKEALPDA